jgi:hypothetical protein
VIGSYPHVPLFYHLCDVLVDLIFSSATAKLCLFVITVEAVFREEFVLSSFFRARPVVGSARSSLLTARLLICSSVTASGGHLTSSVLPWFCLSLPPAVG